MYNYPYNMFNQEMIERQIAYERQQMYDWQQKTAVADAVKATNDLIDSLLKIDPPYQDEAISAVLITLIGKMGGEMLR
jgi:hypothetical protein